MPFFVRRVDHLQAWHSASPPPVSSLELIHICFGCFFCVVSVSPCNIDGAVLAVARHKKETTYPELIGPNARCRLVVLAGETGGRWSEETRSFVGLLAKAKSCEVLWVLKKRVEQSWWFRWGSLLACAAARAFAASLLDVRVSGGADGSVPSCHEVVHDARHALIQ